jgi:hypothetical protein
MHTKDFAPAALRTKIRKIACDHAVINAIANGEWRRDLEVRFDLVAPWPDERRKVCLPHPPPAGVAPHQFAGVISRCNIAQGERAAQQIIGRWEPRGKTGFRCALSLHAQAILPQKERDAFGQRFPCAGHKCEQLWAIGKVAKMAEN